MSHSVYHLNYIQTNTLIFLHECKRMYNCIIQMELTANMQTDTHIFIHAHTQTH